MDQEVIIVGGGLAGLSCARILKQNGIAFTLLEAADQVGGRIRTDVVDGFRLDRGFQVFLDSYPEAKAVLDLEALDLKPFLPGALIRFQGGFHELTDPFRRPLSVIGSLFSPIGTTLDKLRVASFRAKTLSGNIDDRFSDLETTSLTALQSAGFSSSMIDQFFKPFIGGIFLDPDLLTSSRMLSFVFRMFSIGNACLPSEGMEAIPRQLASLLPADCIRLGTRVTSVTTKSVTLASGEQLHGKAVVVAVEGPSAARLLGDDSMLIGQAVTCIYFAAASPPITKRLLVLNGDGRGPINNLCIPTTVASSYGPQNQSLVSVTVLGGVAESPNLLSEVRSQLVEWFGADVREWRHLKTYSIPYALPNQFAPALEPPERTVRWSSGVFVCGDHRDNASIQGAMVSGRRAAEAILKDLA